MSIFLFTGCGKKNEETPPKDETVPYTVGAISDGVYKNESLKLKYASIDGMKVANDEELGQLK